MPFEAERLRCGESRRCIAKDPVSVSDTSIYSGYVLFEVCSMASIPLGMAYRILARNARCFVIVTGGGGWRVLGRGNRRALPACAVVAIRHNYPSPSGSYTGFKDVPHCEYKTCQLCFYLRRLLNKLKHNLLCTIFYSFAGCKDLSPK